MYFSSFWKWSRRRDTLLLSTFKDVPPIIKRKSDRPLKKRTQRFSSSLCKASAEKVSEKFYPSNSKRLIRRLNCQTFRWCRMKCRRKGSLFCKKDAVILMLDSLFGGERKRKKEKGISLLGTVFNNIECDLLCGMLENNGIPFILKEDGGGSFSKIVTGFSIFGTHIYVSDGDLERAKELLAFLRESTESDVWSTDISLLKEDVKRRIWTWYRFRRGTGGFFISLVWIL